MNIARFVALGIGLVCGITFCGCDPAQTTSAPITSDSLDQNPDDVVVPITMPPWQTGIVYGSVSYGGQIYRTVVIGSQTWMAENLNYAGTDGKIGLCYHNSVDSCTKYGRLYSWTEVVNGSASSSANPSGLRGICPLGWHVPSDSEWTILQNFAGASDTTNGMKLKTTSGWAYDDGKDTWGSNPQPGTDAYGFRALPGGHFGGLSREQGDSVRFYGVGYFGNWWTATEHQEYGPMFRSMNFNDSFVYSYKYDKEQGFSLRCVQD